MLLCRGVRVVFASEPVARNTVILDGDAGRLGRLLLLFKGAGNTLSISGRSSGHRLYGRVDFYGNGSEVMIGARRHQNSRITVRLWNDRQLFYFGAGSTSNGLEVAIQGDGRCVLVGEDCMFSHGVWIRNSDMHTIFDLERMEKSNREVDIVVEPHVWVGQDALLMKCKTIGLGSIIGARSLVRGDVEPFTLAAGVPARTVKKRVSWDRGLVVRRETLEFLRTFE